MTYKHHDHPTIEYAVRINSFLFNAGAEGLKVARLVALMDGGSEIATRCSSRTVWDHIHALHEAHLIYISDHTHAGEQTFAWQPVPGKVVPDHVRVTLAHVPTKKREAVKMQHFWEVLSAVVAPR